MFLPEFRSEEEVWQFVDLSNDSWCLPMVEEYLELIHVEISNRGLRRLDRVCRV